MVELRRNSAIVNRLEDFHLLDGFVFECHRVVDGSGDSVESHVEITEHQLTEASVACGILRGVDNLIDKRLRNGFTSDIMFCEAVEELLLRKIVFVKLRGQFHEVAINRCARHRSIAGICEKTVERMTKLVEECFHLVGSEQRRLVGSGLSEIHHNRHMRP